MTLLSVIGRGVQPVPAMTKSSKSDSQMARSRVMDVNTLRVNIVNI